MKEFIKRNVGVLVALMLPVMFILVVALAVYLPSLSLSTKYDFVYATCSEGDRYSYSCDKYLSMRFSVVDGKLTTNPVSQDATGDKLPNKEAEYTVRVFLHDTQANESREISLEEARALSLNRLVTSPDGVSVSGEYTSAPNVLFIFDGNSSYDNYLTKGSSRRKLNLIDQGGRRYYSNDIHFIGWVLPARN